MLEDAVLPKVELVVTEGVFELSGGRGRLLYLEGREGLGSSILGDGGAWLRSLVNTSRAKGKSGNGGQESSELGVVVGSSCPSPGPDESRR